jgi:alkaline phosphatase D
VKDLAAFLAASPCVQFINRQRGYVRCTITPQSWTSDYRIVEKVTAPGVPAHTLKSFVVEAGRPGVHPA